MLFHCFLCKKPEKGRKSKEIAAKFSKKSPFLLSFITCLAFSSLFSFLPPKNEKAHVHKHLELQLPNAGQNIQQSLAKHVSEYDANFVNLFLAAPAEHKTNIQLAIQPPS